MKLLFCLGLIFSFLVTQAYDDCDNKRTEAVCNASPGVCYWNSSNVHKGHACVKFSGDCTVIKTNISTECTNAGGGLLCDWQILGANPGIGSCVDRCSRLNSSSCDDHTYCWGWNFTSNKCLSCVEIGGNTDCESNGNCVWDTTCKIGCGGLYPILYNPQGSSGSGGCLGNSSCYVSVTGGSYGSYYGYCKNFPGCAGIGDGTTYGQSTCNYKGGNANRECRWDTTTPPGICAPSCETLTSTACITNSRCYWNSYTGKCAELYGSCTTVQTHVATDCTNAKEYLNYPGDYKSCTYKSGFGCVTKCTDYVSTDVYPTNYLTNCNDREDCWWDSTPLTGTTGTTYFAGCKDVNDCPDINNDAACSAANKKLCYWTGSNCVAITRCSDIGTSKTCGTAGSRCKWNTTACVDDCTFIENQYDCQDRPDCRWNNGKCEVYSSVSIFSCSGYTSSSLCPTERCVFQSGMCLDRIFSPISDERGRGCSSYNNDNVACNTDPKCVYNSGQSQCLNYTSCDDITYSGFGGVFSQPQDDCNAKQGCIWEAGNDNPACGMVIGKCVGVVGSPADCSTNKYGVECYAASGQGCFWSSSSGSCVKGRCDLFNSLWCETNASCQWSSEFGGVCIPKCSSFTTVTKCRENFNLGVAGAGCFWTGSSCSLFVGKENCSDITTYDDCNLKQCDWFSTNSSDITIGSCFSQYEKANLIVRGCDDIQNEKQCNEYGYSSCTYIWNADRGTGVCTYTNGLNCSWYKNQQQCTNTSRCYWNGNKYCQEYRDCEDISASDCETGKECGLQPGYTSCSYYPCYYRPFGVCSGKCEWYKGSCDDITDRRALLGSANRVSNSDSVVLGLRVSYDPCYGLYSDRLTCNANKTICNKGCVYNFQNVGGSSGCILFQNCSSIRYPLFQMPEIDCDAKIPCYWNKGECGETAPPSRGKITKFSNVAVAGLLMVLLWLFDF